MSVIRHLHGDETFLLGLFVDERLVDVGNDTTTGDGGLDESIQLFVTTNGELQMAGGDTFHLEILGGISSQFENLCSSCGGGGGGGNNSNVGE